ncbi:MAG TPA: LexA family transcriptional regulator [Chitinophaga sp.]|uniref:XRE family transcriptional regulator n=1 Tax=Chitinophaga sp. TaxID=1869181 RepID=UPI002C097039|nr:LexA family transcriptional regulator [Chitinophaga sp.]HVI47815.1 LexA family transcriptional regulator [Chitinophaga sp.]
MTDKQLIHWAGNLKLLRTRKKLSQQQLADTLGINRNKVSAQESGKTRNPRIDDLVLISAFFRINLDTFLRTDLTILPEDQLLDMENSQSADLTGRHIRILPITVNQDNEENMEYVPVKARAGYRSGFADPSFVASLPRFSLPELPRGKTIRMFPVSGDSMEPIPDGSHVIAQYQEDWLQIKDGTACILVLKDSEEDIVFKMVHNRIRQNGSLLLHSLNSAYNDYEVHVQDILEIWTFIGYISKQLPQQ